MTGVEVFVILCPQPGQSGLRSLTKHLARFILKKGRAESLKLLAARKVVLCRRPLDDAETLARLSKLRLDVGLHKTGIIYRDATLRAFRLGILNAHIGLLPEYRGRNVMEWALLEGKTVGVTVFFVDTGIDTGARVILREAVDISHCKSIEEAKQYLFNLDATLFRRALQLLGSKDFQFETNDGSGRRYYVMSKLFLGVVEKQCRMQSAEVMN